MELIERYIYAVTRHLPEKQREDIEKELRGLIEDMLNERTGGQQPSTKDIEAVLTELGDPSLLADKYMDKKRYLIGPEYYSKYTMLLKLVLPIVAFAMLISTAITLAVNPPQYVDMIFGQIIGAIVDGAVWGFVWITVIFAVLEHFKADIGRHGINKKDGWHPTDLPEIPVKNITIKKSDPIVSIVFMVLICIFINFCPQLLVIYLHGQPAIPILNLSVFRGYLFLIDIGFAMAFIREVLKLIYGRYTVALTITITALNTISFITSIIVFSNFQIWNLKMGVALERIFGSTAPVGYDFNQPILILAKVVLVIIVLTFVLQTITAIIKTLKYSLKNLNL
jgi:hypothetical protein